MENKKSGFLDRRPKVRIPHVNWRVFIEIRVGTARAI